MRTFYERSPSSQVSEADLTRLPVLHELMAALGSPVAGTVSLAPLCAQIPALAERLVLRARTVSHARGPIDVPRALAVLGNQGLEEILLGLLEDLTVLKADRDEARARVEAEVAR